MTKNNESVKEIKDDGLSFDSELKDNTDGLSYDPELENTKIIASDPVVDEPDNDDGLTFDKELYGPTFILDKSYNIDVSKYIGRVGNGTEVYMPNVIEGGIDILNQNRADNQGFFEQAGNFLGQVLVGEIGGGTLEAAGYLLDIGSIIDVMQGDEVEWGNFITEAGQGLREGVEEKMRIHQDPSAEGFGKMADSGWWFSNGVSIASTLSMLIPTMGAMRALSFIGRGIGMTKGLKAVRKAMGMAEQMGTKASWATNGISQAVLSRNIENWMEAHGTFEDYKSSHAGKVNPQTNEKFTDEELTTLASQAASSNWKKGWVMLAQDIPQYLALGKVFNPISKKMVSATNAASKKGITANWKPWQQKSLGVAKTFFGEGGEESYQYLISEQSKLKADLDIGYITQKEYDQKMSDAFGSEEMLTSAFFGGLGGNVFQAAGAGINDVFKSKDRKEYEKNLAESYTQHIGNKSKQVSLMFQYLNQADGKGSKVLRDQVINDSMMTLATEALEMDKFDQFYETIGLVSEMSEEDIKNFENQTGQEFSSELAKQYAPELQKKAIEIRDIYLKHRNYYAPTTSSRLARLEMENKGLETRAEKGKEAAENIKAVVRKNFKTKASETLHTKLALREKGQVLRRRKTALTARLNAEGEDSPKRAFIQEALDDNARSFKKYQLDTRNQTKENKALDTDDKEARDLQAEDDAASEKTYNKLYKEEVLSALESEAVARENIIINNEDMAFSKSEEGISLLKKESLQKKINEYNDIEDDNLAIEKLKEVKDDLADKMDYLSDEEKTSLKESVDAKIKERLDQQQKEDDATAKASINASRLAKLREQNNDPSVASNQKITEIADVVEDENADADPVLSEDQLKDSEKRDKQLVGSGQFMSMLDKVENKDGTSATPGYDEYVVNPSNKVGQEFRYTPVSMDQKLTKDQNNAISDFEKLKPGDDIPQNVLDNLPIQATHTEYKDVFTFLRTKPNQNAPLEDRAAYEQGYASQREIIINKLVNGEDVTSTVALNTGGDLMMDYDTEERLVPEHSVLDLMQINGDESKVKLMVTNKEGFLMDTQKKTDKDLGNRSMLLDRDSADNRMPYRGGVFLKVKKANGEPFALRLNLKKNTKKQAELLAELLIKTGVPVATRDKEGKVITNKKGVQVVEKEIKLSTPLEYLDEDLQNDIREQMGPEIDMLDPKYKNPTVNDLIDSFIYVSEQTEGKTSELYFSSDNHLMFGNGKSITLKNRSEASSQEELVDFLVNNKRRQFKLSMWNENGAYRKYVLDNKIISTDGTIDGPLFQNTRKRTKRGDMTGKRIQLYMNPVKNEAPVQMDENGQVSTMFSLANIPGAKPVKKAKSGSDTSATQQTGEADVKIADIERRTTKVISSEIVEKGNRKGQTRTVTQTNSIEEKEGTTVSVTEYEAKVGDTTVSLGGRAMTVKEFKEEFPMDEDWLSALEDLDDSSIIIVRKVKKVPKSSRFENAVSVNHVDLGGKMDLAFKKDDAKYDAELAVLKPTQPTSGAENTYKIGDTQISANENNDVYLPPKGSPVSQSFLQFSSDEEMDDVDNFDDVDFEDVNMGFDPSEDLSKQDDGKPEIKCKKQE